MFNKNKKNNKNNKGFTLVELLVVIAIIGILAVVAVPSLFKNIDKAKVADLEADISAIKSATISYVSDTNKLPADLSSTKVIANIKSALGNELDTLSNPYNGDYAITSYTQKDDDKKIKSGDVILKITLGSDLSSTAIDKIESDLESMAVGGDKTSIVDVENSKQVITVLLMNGAGLSKAS